MPFRRTSSLEFSCIRRLPLSDDARFLGIELSCLLDNFEVGVPLPETALHGGMGDVRIGNLLRARQHRGNIVSNANHPDDPLCGVLGAPPLGVGAVPAMAASRAVGDANEPLGISRPHAESAH